MIEIKILFRKPVDKFDEHFPNMLKQMLEEMFDAETYVGPDIHRTDDGIELRFRLFPNELSKDWKSYGINEDGKLIEHWKEVKE